MPPSHRNPKDTALRFDATRTRYDHSDTICAVNSCYHKSGAMVTHAIEAVHSAAGNSLEGIAAAFETGGVTCAAYR